MTAVPATAGLVVVDKPAGLTSHDVVARVRRLAHTRRVGHAGTLDPMATGVLLVGVERVTKLLGYLAAGEKTYRACVRFGAATVTDDARGEVVSTAPTDELDDAAVRAALAAQTGELDQVPSAVSAVKVDGRRAYDRVRAGEEVRLAPRRVHIGRLDVGPVRRVDGFLDVDIELDCSAGTYVRAVARDAGAALGVGGHLTALRRTRVGAFDLAGAATLEQLADRPDPVAVGMDELVERTFGRRDVDAETARAAANGARLPADGRDGPYALFGPDGLAVSLVEERDGLTRALVVLRPA